MFEECQQCLIKRLKEAAGANTEVHTNLETLKASQESHIGAVLFDEELLDRNGSKRIFRDENNLQKKRRKVFDRDLIFNVAIGEYTKSKAEAIYETFMTVLDRGIYVNGNYVYFEPEKADWVDKEDSILKAKVAVEVKIRCKGGIYKDTDYIKVKEVVVEVEKEETNGRK